LHEDESGAVPLFNRHAPKVCVISRDKTLRIPNLGIKLTALLPGRKSTASN